MLTRSLPLVASSLLFSSIKAAPAPAAVPVPPLYAEGVLELSKRQDGLTPYQPVSTSCPDTPLVRNATGLSPQESDYISSRKDKADAALASWLEKHGSFNTDSQPSVALASSGGGYRALLSGAGVVQAFDARDSDTDVSGLYQALTYHSGLSGKSAWELSLCVVQQKADLIRWCLVTVLDFRQRLADNQLPARKSLGRLIRSFCAASGELVVLLGSHTVWCDHH